MKPNIKTFTVGLTMMILASLGSKRESPMIFTNVVTISTPEIKTTPAVTNQKSNPKVIAHPSKHTNTKSAKSNWVSSDFVPVSRNTFAMGPEPKEDHSFRNLQ